MSTVKENIETMKDLGSSGYDAVRQLGELNMKSMEMVMNRQMDAVSIIMEASMRQFSLVSEAKGYNDLVKAQVELTKELGERMMEVGRENIKLANETQDQYRAWFDKGVESVSDKMGKFQPSV